MMTDTEKMLKIVDALEEKKAAQREKLEAIKALPGSKSILALEERVKKFEALVAEIIG